MKNHIILSVILLTIAVFVYAQNPVDFKLTAATSKSQFILSNEKGKFVALHFLLKTDCPYCIRHVQEYFSKAGRLPNVVQVFIKPDSDTEIEAWTSMLTGDELEKFPIYRDPDSKLADQFSIPGGYAFHNQIVHFPAIVLLGPDGKEVFRYVGKNNNDRFSFELLVLKVNELTKK